MFFLLVIQCGIDWPQLLRLSRVVGTTGGGPLSTALASDCRAADDAVVGSSATGVIRQVHAEYPVSQAIAIVLNG